MIETSRRLRRAILLNDVVLVQRIVRKNAILQNPDFSDKATSSLHLAASLGLSDIASLLIRAGHESHEISRTTDNDTPLHLAARHGHVEVGLLLIAAFPQSIHFVNNAGLDALAIAAQNPSATGLMITLLQHPDYPASPHSRDQDGNTPLHHASASGSLKALRILLATGANPLAKNNHDWTPLAYSQTVAAEVYFKNLITEFERRKIEGTRASEERERQRAAGVRVVASETPGYVGEDDGQGDSLRRQWSPVQRRKPFTPGSAPARAEWGLGLQHVRTRSGTE